jgi:DUF4097 and DUF4098 domain-containing protein YvlB
MQKTFEITGPVDLDVTLASGELEVLPGTDGTVDVELVAHDADSQELVDNATVELRGRELVVALPDRRGWKLSFGNRGITCTIHCADGSSLKARTKSADVTAAVNLARADVATASGDISLRDVSGDANVKCASGDITVGDVGGRASINTASGDITLGSVSGDVRANTASGDISVDAAANSVKANSASGDISVDAVERGEISINSASGDVGIAIRRGTRAHLDCSTVSGDTVSELGVSGDEPNGNGPLAQIKVRTVSGDINISRAPAPADNAQEVQA